MHPVVSWGDLGYPGVSWRNQTDPFNLVKVIAFTKKNLLHFLSNQHSQSSSPYK